tara:strand:- start:1883 stop:2221 length:339 start_codon:yes stop_codon:yes gene_type:complete
MEQEELLFRDVLRILRGHPGKVVVLDNVEIALQDMSDSKDREEIQRVISSKCSALKTYYLDVGGCRIEVNLDGDILRRAKREKVVPVINYIASYILNKEIVGKVVLRQISYR